MLEDALATEAASVKARIRNLPGWEEVQVSNFIVVGVPRSGKTTLSKVLCAECAVSLISGDALVSSFMKVHPELGITHHGNSHAANCEALQPFLLEYLRQMSHEQIPYVLDTYHLLPEMAAEIMDLHHVCFLGYPGADPGRKLESIRRQAPATDWTCDLSDDELEALVQRFIAESRALQIECERLEIPFIDTEREGAVSVELALATLIGSESD